MAPTKDHRLTEFIGVDLAAPGGDRSATFVGPRAYEAFIKAGIPKDLLTVTTPLPRVSSMDKVCIIAAGAGEGRQAFEDAARAIGHINFIEAGIRMREDIARHFQLPTTLLAPKCRIDPEAPALTAKSKALRKMQALNKAENFKDVLSAEKLYRIKQDVQELNKKNINDQLSNYIDMKLGVSTDE